MLARSRGQSHRDDVSPDTLPPTFTTSGLHREEPRIWAAVRAQGERCTQRQEAQWRAMDQLPIEFRAALVVGGVQGPNSSAVAVLPQISGALVRQGFHYGLQRLMNLVEPVMPEPR